VEKRFSAKVQISTGVQIACCAEVTEIFLVVKRLGRGVGRSPPPPSSAGLRKKQSYISIAFWAVIFSSSVKFNLFHTIAFDIVKFYV
jgi:hypothetical protein